MPWWSWLVIWTVLVLGLFVMLGFFAWWLVRKLMATAREASALLAKAEVLSRRANDLRDEVFHPAVFADAVELRDRRAQARADRELAQQARRNARVRRGKILVNTNPYRYARVTQTQRT